jgi:hypothetical protein
VACTGDHRSAVEIEEHKTKNTLNTDGFFVPQELAAFLSLLLLFIE